jgi:hypothetical protein
MTINVYLPSPFVHVKEHPTGRPLMIARALIGVMRKNPDHSELHLTNGDVILVEETPQGVDRSHGGVVIVELVATR